MKNIGILGGSFNPVHNGHIEIAKEVLKSKLVDEIWFMPNGKTYYKNTKLEDSKHRYNMLLKATEGIEKITVSDMEINREGYTYTYDTVKLLEEYEDTFYFIIGADSFYGLYSWYEADKLLEITNFIVINRDDHTDNSLRRDVFEYDLRHEGHFIFHKMKKIDISSTMIRDKVASNESIDAYVPKKVAEYIKKWKLYK